MQIHGALPVLGALLISGCALFEYTATKPIIHREADSGTGTDIYALMAERRVIVSQSEKSDRRFCSEPPPDVAQSFADSVRAALQLAAQQQYSINQSSKRSVETPPPQEASSPASARNQSASQDGSGSQSAGANGSLDIARDFATSISQIYTRSQGVQLFRDGSFMLCQANLNNAVRGDRVELAKQLALARVAVAEQLNRSIREQSAEGQRVLSDIQLKRNMDIATTLVPDPIKTDDLNYSAKFSELLAAVKEVLLVEVPKLYENKQAEDAKKSANDAAAIATTARVQAAASAGEAKGAVTNAAASALAAQNASVEAKKSETAAKQSADAAQAAANKLGK